MLKLKTTTRFEKDYRKAIKSGREMVRLKRTITWIASEQPLPPELRDHKLVGNYQGRRGAKTQGPLRLETGYRKAPGCLPFRGTKMPPGDLFCLRK